MAHDSLIETPRYRVRLARDEGDLARALHLRAQMFRGDPLAADADAFDPKCRHLMVEARADGALMATCRLLDLADGNWIGESYAAQFYGLDALAGYRGRMIELGRFAVAPQDDSGEALRLALAGLTGIVEEEGVEMLFGCSSFAGTGPEPYLDAFALLRARHLAPERWQPRIKAGEVFRFAARLRRKPDLKRASKVMPPLLRSYLAMGGWVSDHAVIDRDLGTLHVFTGLEIGAVPPARARALRSLRGLVEA